MHIPVREATRVISARNDALCSRRQKHACGILCKGILYIDSNNCMEYH